MVNRLAETLICPNGGSCKVYEVYSWDCQQQGARANLNVVRNLAGNYYCLALDCFLGEVIIDDSSKKVLSHMGIKEDEISCSCVHLTLLNKLQTQ